MSKAALAVKLTSPDAIKRAAKSSTHNWEAFTKGVTISGYHFDTVAQAYATLSGLDGEAIDSIVREHCAIIAIPFFPGFYHSSLDADLDHEESQWADYEAEKIQPGSQYHKLEDHELGPELAAIRKLIPDWTLSADDFASAAFDATDYSAVHLEASQYWVENLNHVISDQLDFELDAQWESMTSPRFYNFETDRVFAFIPWAKLESMLEMLKGKAELPALIKRRFTSRSGFISHYSNELAEWESKPLREWDHNETGTLLQAFLQALSAGAGEEWEDIESAINQLDSGNGESSQCLDAGRDYEKLFDSLREKIADATAEHLESHPEIREAAEAAQALADLRHGTPDMFEGESNG